MSLKILTVDDSRIVRMLVTRSLQGCDCQIVEATNGKEGLAAATSEKPDLILLDLTMPRMNVLRSVVMNHLIHHRAQLGVYLRLNDCPVPGLYGPSADEKA